MDPDTGEQLWSVSTGDDEIGVPLSIVAVRNDGGETFFGAGSSVLAVPAAPGGELPQQAHDK